MSTWPRTRDGLQWGTAMAIVAVAVDLVLLLLNWQHVESLPTSVFFTSQLLLVATWMAFGHQPFLVRVACFASFVVIAVSALADTFRYFQTSASMHLPETVQYVLILPFPCFVLRLIGFEVVHPDRPSALGTASDSKFRRVMLAGQVSAWGCALAVLGLAFIPSFYPAWFIQLPSWCAVLAVLAAGAVWAVLAPKDLIFRSAAYLLGALGLAAGFWLTSGPALVRDAALAQIIVECWALVPMVVVLLGFRLLGYRLTWLGWQRSSGVDRQIGSTPHDIAARVANQDEQSSPIITVDPCGAAWFARFNSEQLKRFHALAALLVATIVVFDLIASQIVRRTFAAATLTPNPSKLEAGEVLLQILIICQTGLIGVWAGLGTMRGLVRFPLAIAGLAVSVWLALIAVPPLRSDSWFPLFVGYGSMAGTAALGLIIARATGIRLGRTAGRGSTLAMPRRRFQFSMLQAMIAMTEVGILAALLKLAYQIGNPFRADNIFGTIAQGAVMGILVLLAAWIAFGRRWANVRLIVAAGLLCGVVWGLSRLSPGAAREQLYIFSIVILLTAMITAPLAVFRVCGYRFERTRKGTPHAPS